MSTELTRRDECVENLREKYESPTTKKVTVSFDLEELKDCEGYGTVHSKHCWCPLCFADVYTFALTNEQ